MKKTIFLDFDNCLFNTDKALIELFKSQGGKTIGDKTWEDIRRWDYADIIEGGQPVIDKLFKSKGLYTRENIFNGVVALFKEYYDKGHKIIVASIGNAENSINKIKLISEIMPYAIQIPTIHHDVLSLTKEHYNMENCFFADDSVKILGQTNSSVDVLVEFSREKEESIGYKGLRAKNVKELSEILKEYL